MSGMGSIVTILGFEIISGTELYVKSETVHKIHISLFLLSTYGRRRQIRSSCQRRFKQQHAYPTA